MCEEIYTIPANGIPAVFSDTGVELGLTVNFVNWVKDNYYPNLIIVRPEKSFDWVLKNKGKPLRSKMKSADLHQWQAGNRTETLTKLLTDAERTSVYAKHALANRDMHFLHDDFPIKPSASCCDYLKKKPLSKYARENNILGCILGIRTEEGGVRETSAAARVNAGGQLCTWVRDGITNKAPIIDWSESDVDEFVLKYNIPISDAYTKYNFDRTGCIACPFSLQLEQNLKYLFENEPLRYKAAMHWLKDVYIAQDVRCPFDDEYESERSKTWNERYTKMRLEMLEKYRPDSRLLALDKLLALDNKIENDRCDVTDYSEPLNVLVIGDTQQMICTKFRQRGHRAFSCTPDWCDGAQPNWHIRGDGMDLLDGDCTFCTQDGEQHEQVGAWDMIIANPPCKYIAKGGAVRLFRKEFKEYPKYGTFQMINADRIRDGILNRDIFMRILNAKCDKIAIENPVLMNIFAIPDPTQVIEPYQFGDPYKRQTCLWLKGLPSLSPTDIVEPTMNWVNGGSKNADGTKRAFNTFTNAQARSRVKAFPGIAKAMADQWG